MFSPRSPKNDLHVDILNPYMAELRMHPMELLLKDGKVQIEDVRGPKSEVSLEDRMEKLEQEVFMYKKMAERQVDIFYKINSEFVSAHKKEVASLWEDILSPRHYPSIAISTL